MALAGVLGLFLIEKITSKQKIVAKTAIVRHIANTYDLNWSIASAWY